MRYAALILLGSFGVFLFFIARYRYQAVNVQVAGLNTVEAVVQSIGPDGELNLKYKVGAEAFEIVRRVPIRIPRIRAGDRVTLFYNSARPDTAKVRQWSVLYPDSLVAGGFGLLAIVFAVGAFVALGRVPSVSEALKNPESQIERTHESSIPIPASLDAPIELHNARNEFYISFLMAAGAFVAAFFLYRSPPWFLATRWLSYPVVALIVLFGIGMIFAAFGNQEMRIRANQDGVEIIDSSGSRKFLWTDVAALKRETVSRSTYSSGKVFSRGYSDKVMGRSLILLDRAGKELLKLDEDVAMEPVRDWMRLRAYIPKRTGLEVKEAARETLL